MSEILFGQSYYLRFDPKLWKAMQPYPPLGTLYAASYMRRKGYEVALFDAMLAESEAEWAQALNLHEPRFAVLFEDNFNYLSKMCLLRMRQAAFTMVEMARQRGCTVIVCGSDASDHPAKYLAQGADYVLVGEGEITLGELIDRLTGRSETPIQAIPGLAFHLGSRSAAGGDVKANSTGMPASMANGTVITPRRPDIKDLDALPIPAWNLVDLFRYQDIWYSRHGYYSMNVVTTRGCPFHCNWCAKPIWGQRYNSRSPENLVAELTWLRETYHPDHIWFVDDIFGLKPGWLPQFAELVEAQGFRLPFKSLNRVDLLLRDGEIEALQRAGCHTVWAGAESGSQKILDGMDKGTKVEQIYEATRRLHQAGIRVGLFLQFGYPGETRADIEKTLQMVRDCRPDDIGMSVSYPLPGTKFYKAVKVQLGKRKNWTDSNDLAMLYKGHFTTSFYRHFHTVLHKEFRMRKTWWKLTGRLTREQNPINLRSTKKESAWREIVAVVYHAITLPLARWKLERLARVPHQGLGPLPQIKTPEEAAQPSPQLE